MSLKSGPLRCRINFHYLLKSQLQAWEVFSLLLSFICLCDVLGHQDGSAGKGAGCRKIQPVSKRQTNKTRIQFHFLCQVTVGCRSQSCHSPQQSRSSLVSGGLKHFQSGVLDAVPRALVSQLSPRELLGLLWVHSAKEDRTTCTLKTAVHGLRRHCPTVESLRRHRQVCAPDAMWKTGSTAQQTEERWGRA